MRKSKKLENFLSEADLNWTLKDYENHRKEPPERIKNNPLKTEGEIMTDEEIENWFTESVQVLRILKEEDKEIFLKVHKGFILDLEYLFSLNKIDEEVLEYAEKLDNFNF